MKDYLIVVEGENKFGPPFMTHRLIEVSEEFLKGFYAGVVLFNPHKEVTAEEIP